MKNKNIDAVGMMRKIRDELSQKYVKAGIAEEIDDLERKFPNIKGKKISSKRTKNSIR